MYDLFTSYTSEEILTPANSLTVIRKGETPPEHQFIESLGFCNITLKVFGRFVEFRIGNKIWAAVYWQKKKPSKQNKMAF